MSRAERTRNDGAAESLCRGKGFLWGSVKSLGNVRVLWSLVSDPSRRRQQQAGTYMGMDGVSDVTDMML